MSHECPICETTFHEFREVSARKPRKAKCPHCGSVERHRFFWLLQRDSNLLPEGGRMLHFSPEPWLIEPMSQRYGPGYLLVDYELPPYDVKVDIQHLPFRDGLFDGLMCFGVLEHIPDDLKAMQELARVLRPGGRAIIHVPTQFKTYESWRDPLGPAGRRQKYGQVNHLRYYGLDVKDTLLENGFEAVHVIRPSDRHSQEEIIRYGLTNSSCVIVGDAPTEATAQALTRRSSRTRRLVRTIMRDLPVRVGGS